MVSCLLHLLAAFVPFLIFFSVPQVAALAIVFLIRVVVPVLFGSIGVAAVSILMLRRRAQPSTGTREAVALAGSSGIDLLAMSLVATILAIVAVLFMGAYGFILLHFFYGPPVAIQVLVSERLPLRDSLMKARSYLRGQWRLVLYLLSVSLLLGLVSFLVLGAAFTGVRELAQSWRSILLALSQGLVTGAAAALIAAAQVALYLEVRTGYPAAGPEPEPV